MLTLKSEPKIIRENQMPPPTSHSPSDKPMERKMETIPPQLDPLISLEPILLASLLPKPHHLLEPQY